MTQRSLHISSGDHKCCVGSGGEDICPGERRSERDRDYRHVWRALIKHGIHSHNSSEGQNQTGSKSWKPPGFWPSKSVRLKHNQTRTQLNVSQEVSTRHQRREKPKGLTSWSLPSSRCPGSGDSCCVSEEQQEQLTTTHEDLSSWSRITQTGTHVNVPHLLTGNSNIINGGRSQERDSPL